MEQVITAPAEREILVDTLTIQKPRKHTWWDTPFIKSPNGDHPEVFSTVTVQEHDEDGSGESEGWRYIETTTEEGQVKRERVPLTAYEFLHPQEGYVIVHTTPHGRNVTYIDNTVNTHLIHEPQTFVLNDVRTDFNLPGIEPVSPDVSVIFDVREEKDWSTFDCQEEGAYPSVVFEVTSPKTRSSDFGEKYDYYRWAGVSYYVILDIHYDRNKQVSGYSLFVYELDGNEYMEMKPDHQDRYWLPTLGIWVGLGDKGILCYDALGNLLLSHEEAIHALNEKEIERSAAQALADEQTRLVEQETARAAEQERIAEQERMIAQQEAARANEQERIAQQEAARATEQERIAQQETARAVEQERIAQHEAARAAEQERIASEVLQAQQAAEAQIAELLARVAELEGNPKRN